MNWSASCSKRHAGRPDPYASGRVGPVGALSCGDTHKPHGSFDTGLLDGDDRVDQSRPAGPARGRCRLRHEACRHELGADGWGCGSARSAPSLRPPQPGRRRRPRSGRLRGGSDHPTLELEALSVLGCEVRSKLEGIVDEGQQECEVEFLVGWCVVDVYGTGLPDDCAEERWSRNDAGAVLVADVDVFDALERLRSAWAALASRVAKRTA